jgi:UDP-N-acetylglucosamine 2-epimerase (non-hydrolysing)
MIKIISVVGARPNFMKIAPFIIEISKHNKERKVNNAEPIQHVLVHTGQHYDDRMSTTFFESLNIPQADINLGVGSGSHAEQVGKTMIAIEKVLVHEKPDWVIVVGDVNATLACSVTAKKLNIKVCHIEAGLRSGDMTMPEEINRLVTDRLSDLLLVPDRLSQDNLISEGVPKNKIAFVGNIMIDTLETNRVKAEKLVLKDIIKANTLNVSADFPNFSNYALLTMHRPSNVDKKEILKPLVDFLSNEVTKDNYLIWPIHPRTQNQIKKFGLWENLFQHERVVLLHPVGYHEMLKLNMDASIILTDSGGLQEESCVLGTPCLTLRWNTERPITLRENGGASVLVGNNIEGIRREYFDTLSFNRKPQRPELWDGKTALRCLNVLITHN